jgi:hypothetical protein
VDKNVVSPGYFETVASPILEGRDFDRRDRPGGADVAIVNEQMARQFWGGNAIGRQVRGGSKIATIVGIVRDGSRRNYRRPVPPCLYLAAAQEPMRTMQLVVRAKGNPLAPLPAVRETIASLNPGAVIGDAGTLSSYANTVLAQERMAAWCLGALAALALALSSVGLYGSISFWVSQRTPEIGLRMALGAGRGQILRMIAAGAAKVAFAGVAVGSAAAFLLARYARALLFGVAETDPGTWAAGVLVLCLAALAAGAGPARKAAGVDPAVALRSE